MRRVVYGFMSPRGGEVGVIFWGVAARMGAGKTSMRLFTYRE
jgi:hypothetical protein